MRSRSSLVLLAVGVSALTGCARSGVPAADSVQTNPASASVTNAAAAALDHRLRDTFTRHGSGIAGSVWVGRPTSGAWYEWQADVLRPTASAIKTFLLVELFAAHAHELDSVPPGVASILDDSNAAITALPREWRKEVRPWFQDATVRQIGEIMMGKTVAPNVIYNAAANIAIAALGGPEGVTRRIHARDPAFARVFVRRYMLAPRTPADNEATAAALAAVHQGLASRRLVGVDDRTVEAMRDAMLVERDPKRGTHYSKDGELYSDPLTQVMAGWWETATDVVVYVVMTVQADPGHESRERACARQIETTARLREQLIHDALSAPERNGKTGTFQMQPGG
jgi:hypothetical protein